MALKNAYEDFGKVCETLIAEFIIKGAEILPVNVLTINSQEYFRKPFVPCIPSRQINNGSTRTMYEICLKLTIKTPERRSGIHC